MADHVRNIRTLYCFTDRPAMAADRNTGNELARPLTEATGRAINQALALDTAEVCFFVRTLYYNDFVCFQTTLFVSKFLCNQSYYSLLFTIIKIGTQCVHISADQIVPSNKLVVHRGLLQSVQ